VQNHVETVVGKPGEGGKGEGKPGKSSRVLA
jgi:hypothetical protein